jgi:MFS transporter, putative metabolite:H+ symporter
MPNMASIENASVRAEIPESGEAISSRGGLAKILSIMCYLGFNMGILIVAAPWISRSFGLSEGGLARLYALIGCGSFGALGLSRLIDRLGRRRMLLASMLVIPFSAAMSAASTTILQFAVSQMVFFAFVGAALSATTVMLAETLPTEERAKGQGYGGTVMALGNAICIIAMPFVAGTQLSWRWLFILSAGGVVLLLAAMRIPETERWTKVAVERSSARQGFLAIFEERYRKRAYSVLAWALLSTVANAAAQTWQYFHAVVDVGLSPGATSTVMLVSGAVAMVGFPIGALACERLGRVRTLLASGIVAAVGGIAFYWGPSAHFPAPAVWLLLSLGIFSTAFFSSTVASNSALTELFPTAQRATIMGWFAVMHAVGTIATQAAIGAFAAPLGGLASFVGWLIIAATLGSTIAVSFVDETKGLTLEMSAQESM